MDYFPFSIIRKLVGLEKQDDTAMEVYNALVKEYPLENQIQPKIVGRIFVKDLAQVPKSWTVFYRGSTIGWDTDLTKLIYTSTNPLIIYKGPEIPAPIRVTANIIFHDHVDKREIETYESDTIKKLKTLIDWKYPEIVIIYYEKHCDGILALKDEKQLKDYGIEDGSELKVRLWLRGGGTFTGPDVEQYQVDGEGVPTDISWKAYGPGLNLVGECPNTFGGCRSLNEREGQREVVYQAGYGEITSTNGRFVYACPACPIQNEQSFRVTKFVVSVGRSLFLYTKVGAENEEKAVELESLGPLVEYKSLGGGTPGENLTRYADFRIITVKPEASFHHCVWCDKNIELVENEDAENDDYDEIILACGHPYHKTCAKATSLTNCRVCESTWLDSFYYWLTLENGNEGE